jgi:predicted NACHT family NTPase
MPKRGLQASKAGIDKANIALAQYSLSQNALAKDLGLSRSTVNNFFKGQPIERENFALICDRLGLDLESTVAIDDSPSHECIDPSSLDALVQDIRQKGYDNIQKRCGTMRVLDMEQPISLDSIYTKVNILEKISRNQRRTIADLTEGCDLEDFDRFTLGRVRQKRIPGVEAVQRHDKLMILGKPGAGKSTFLKWLAIQCNEGQLHHDRVPIFVTLKEFAEIPGQPGLQTFIGTQFESYGIGGAQDTAQVLLQAGRGLVLLDGLDEVRDADHDRILREICNLSTQFDASQFVITCRIAAREYTFERFTEVEVADFDDEQIKEFSRKRFEQKDAVKADQFPQELENHKPLQELATNPLLLTLLCLVFEEQAAFPANRAELYKEGLDVLLKKWDAKRNIRRDQVYKELSLKRKKDLLSQLAFTTFELGNYFFKQRDAEHLIESYIQNLPGAQADPEALRLDSEAVLRSIEAQHGVLVERSRGIYSFSHLTFHEYFTARELESRPELHLIMSHLTEKRWREVFLLVAGMLKNADTLLLLMKSQIDQMLATDEKLQQYLIWVQQKSSEVNANYKYPGNRAFYFSLNLALDLNLALNIIRDTARARAHTLDLARSLNVNLNCDLALDFNLILTLIHSIDHDLTLQFIDDLSTIFDSDYNFDPNLALKRAIQVLRDQLPIPGKDGNDKTWNEVKQWWQANRLAWTAELRAVMIKYRNIGHDWQFNDAQKEQLGQYYAANKLLIDCLNSACYVSRHVRQEIEDSLLLPIAEIEQRFPRQSS